MAPLRRLRQFARLNWSERADLAVAVWELARANRRLAGGQEGQPIARHASRDDPPPAEAVVDRVAWAIPRAAAVVPWRADCLRQAEAARRWLSRYGITAEIRLGARKDANGRLDAHAWLLCGARVVTGGKVCEYQEFG